MCPTPWAYEAGYDADETSEGETRGRQIAKTGEGVVGSSKRKDRSRTEGVYKRVTERSDGRASGRFR